MTDAKGQGKSVEELFPCPFFTGAETGQCKSNGSLYAAHHLWEEAAKRLKGQIKGQAEKKEVRNLTVSDFSVAAGEGFEPSHTESESAVLPLHNPAILHCSQRCVVQRTNVIIAGTLHLSTGKFLKNQNLENSCLFPTFPSHPDGKQTQQRLEHAAQDLSLIHI